MKHATLATFAALAVSQLAWGQSPIFGYDETGRRTFRTDASDFEGGFTPLAADPARSLAAIDFDAQAGSLRAIDDFTSEILAVDPATGVASPTGYTAPGVGFGVLRAAPDGQTWYAHVFNPFGVSRLFAGDLTGNMQPVGDFGSILMSAIAVDSRGRMFGSDRDLRRFYSIDPATAQATLIGDLGIGAYELESMDFDWASGALLATFSNTQTGVGAMGTIDVLTGAVTFVQTFTSLDGAFAIALEVPLNASIGVPYHCPATMNSTGAIGLASAIGSPYVSENRVTLIATSLPTDSFGYFIVSRDQGVIVAPGGSLGTLCLTGDIGRYRGPGEVQSSGAAGRIDVPIDLMNTPTPTGFVAVLPGETWSFQLWHRDQVQQMFATVNFTTGVEVLFR